MSTTPQDLSGQDFIVVGGAGYIGSHVCKEIHRAGGRPITFDNLSSGHEHAVKWGPLVKVDVREIGAFEAGLSHAEVNIGTGQGVSVLEILESIKKVTGKSVPYGGGPRRDGDLTRLYADAAKAKSVLGFTPKHSDLENIIATAWAFHRKTWS